jgi:hypothetical protein
MAEAAPHSISETPPTNKRWTPKHNRPSLPSIKHVVKGRVSFFSLQLYK